MGQHGSRGRGRPQRGLKTQLDALKRDMGPGPFWVLAGLVIALVAGIFVFAASTLGTTTKSATSSSSSTSATSEESSVDYSNPKVQEFVALVQPIVREQRYLDDWVTVGWQVCDWFSEGATAGQIEYRIKDNFLAQLGEPEPSASSIERSSAPGNLTRSASITLCRPY